MYNLSGKLVVVLSIRTNDLPYKSDIQDDGLVDEANVVVNKGNVRLNQIGQLKGKTQASKHKHAKNLT